MDTPEHAWVRPPSPGSLQFSCCVNKTGRAFLPGEIARIIDPEPRPGRTFVSDLLHWYFRDTLSGVLNRL